MRLNQRALSLVGGVVVVISAPLASNGADIVVDRGDTPPPSFASDSPRTEKIRSGDDTYAFTVWDYTPPVALTPIAHNAASYETPEQAAIAFHSAIWSGDYDWWLESWDAESRSHILERNQRTGRDREFWVKKWQEATAGETLTYTCGAGVEGMVLITGEQRNAAGHLTVRSITVFKKGPQGWRATNALASHPVYLYWQEPAPPSPQIAPSNQQAQ